MFFQICIQTVFFCCFCFLFLMRCNFQFSLDPNFLNITLKKIYMFLKSQPHLHTTQTGIKIYGYPDTTVLSHGKAPEGLVKASWDHLTKYRENAWKKEEKGGGQKVNGLHVRLHLHRVVITKNFTKSIKPVPLASIFPYNSTHTLDMCHRNLQESFIEEFSTEFSRTLLHKTS